MEKISKVRKLKNSELKDRISYYLAVVSFIVGAGLVIAGFCVVPVGEIAGSVIGGAGMFLSFTGAVLGISYHYAYEEGKFRASVNDTINQRITEALNSKNETETYTEISED